MSNAQVFSKLHMELENFEKQLIETWYAESREIVERSKKSRLTNAKIFKDRILELKRKLNTYEQESKDLNELSTEQKSALDSLAIEINQLSLAEKKQQAEASQEKENIDSLENNNAKNMTNLLSKEAVVNSKLEKLHKGIQYFEENLGLKLQTFPDSHLKFTFSCIDKDDEKKTFSFSLKVEGTPGVYQVLECCPPVTDPENMLKDLNESNNLKLFLCRMRKAFKLTLCK